ncbi:MAG: exodeoxyribonuclease VII small subunit [Gammaproteobacteria bacterium]
MTILETNAAALSLSFEEGIQKLELIIKRMEDGQLPMEEALCLFEQGIQLTKHCRQQITSAEQKIIILMQEQGNLIAQPFTREP